jgi:hypothetical protein
VTGADRGASDLQSRQGNYFVNNHNENHSAGKQSQLPAQFRELLKGVFRG